MLFIPTNCRIDIVYTYSAASSFRQRQENILCIIPTSGLVCLSLFLWMEAAVGYPEGLGVSCCNKKASHWTLFAQGKAQTALLDFMVSSRYCWCMNQWRIVW